MTAYRCLAINELLERFAYCGTQLVLILYLAAGHGAGAWGLAGLSTWLGLGDDPTARAVRLYSLFAAATYIAPIGGSLVANRFGRRGTVAAGCALMTIGHFLLIDERLLLMGLAILVIGAGCTIANKLAMVGDLFGDSHDRAIGFARYLAALNIGVVAAPLICGTLGERVGWSWGFGAAGVGMALGTAVFLGGWRSFPRVSGGGALHSAIDRTAPDRSLADRRLVIVAALIPFIIVTVVVNQAYTTVPIWATSHLARQVAGWTLPVSALLTFDGLVSIAAIMLTTRLWAWLAARAREPGDLAKLATGCAIVVAAFGMLALAARGPQAALVDALVFYLILDASAAWIEPSVASFIAARCPPGRSGLPMAIMKSATAIAALSLGWMSSLYTPLGPPGFWSLNAVLAAVAAGMALLLSLMIGRRPAR